MAFKSRDLLDQLADLQLVLEGYSLQQLSVVQANAVKESFEKFRMQLEHQLWKPEGAACNEPPKASDRKNGDVEKMIASVSHDIRIPLNSITGYADLLREEPLNTGQMQHVEAIRSASQTLQGILHELLLFARLKSGQEDAVEIPFDPRSLVREAVSFTRILLQDKSVDFSYSIAEGLPETLIGDPSKLNRILMNLLENATKYVPEGYIKLSVNSQRQDGHCALVIEVADSGIGIPRGEMPHIFKPYYQAKQSGETAGKGHGLGLSIVKKLVDHQNGKIEVLSEEGRGSIFKVQIPYSYKKGAPENDLPAGDPYLFGKDLQGVRVLLFEDNEMNAKLMQARLERWGCLVFHSAKVPVGLQLLQREPFDLILMDLRMPLMDGFQAARRIRNHSSGQIRRIPILAVTADFTAADQEEIRISGIDGVLMKPYDPRELYDELARLSRTGSRIGNTQNRAEQTDQLAGSAETIMSLDYLEAECMGDFSLLEDMVRLLRNNLLEFVGRMKLHIQQADYAAIQEASHKVLSGLKMIQASRYLVMAERIEQLAVKHDTIRSITVTFEAFLEQYPELENALENELNKRK